MFVVRKGSHYHNWDGRVPGATCCLGNLTGFSGFKHPKKAILVLCGVTISQKERVVPVVAKIVERDLFSVSSTVELSQKCL